MADSSQQEILVQVATKHKLKDKSYQVGFCGRDSVGTRMVGAFFFGVGAGIASATFGGYPYVIAGSAARPGPQYSSSEPINLYEACSEDRTRVVE